MINTTQKTIMATAAFSVLLGAALFSSSFADQNEEKFGMKNFQKSNIEKTVEKTENGVVITLTSTESDVVEKIQNKEDKRSEKLAEEGISISKTNLENGVQITLSGDTEEAIEKIQTRSEKMEKCGQKGERGGKRGENQNGE